MCFVLLIFANLWFSEDHLERLDSSAEQCLMLNAIRCISDGVGDGRRYEERCIEVREEVFRPTVDSFTIDDGRENRCLFRCFLFGCVILITTAVDIRCISRCDRI